MGVTDWGEINQPLGAPALGGAGGWADSVAQALNNSDETVDERLATLEAAMEALIDGRVAKTGDTMTGPLTLPDASPAASEDYVDGSSARIQSGRMQVDATGATALTFPVPFGAIPNLVCTPNTADPVMCVVSSLSTTGASVRIRDLAGDYAGPYFVEWVAVGDPA